MSLLRVSTITCCLLTSCALAGGESLTPAEWPHRLGPDGHTATVPGANWLGPWKNPRQLWEHRVGIGCSSVVVAGGLAYTAGNGENRDTVYCFDARTGEIAWKHSYDEPLAAKYYRGGPNSTPTVAGDTVYFLSRKGKIFALATGNGEVRWKRNLARDGAEPPTWGFTGSPLLLDGRLILNVGGAGYALDPADGDTIWKSAGAGAGYADPVPYGDAEDRGLLFFTSSGPVAVDADDGEVRWRQEWKTEYDVHAAKPVVTDHGILISSGYGTGSALLDLADGSQVWRHKKVQHQQAGPVLVDGMIYGVDANMGKPGRLYCLDPADGALRWKHKGFGQGSLIAAGDKLLVLADDGRLFLVAADPESYRELATAKLCDGKTWNIPALADGRVYVRNDQGHVVCYDITR